MGMFDTLICEAPLPDGAEIEPYDDRYEDGAFQTKDLDRGLGLYRITRDGRLEQQCFQLVHREGNPDSDDRWARLPALERRNEHWETVDDFHGRIRFYGDDVDGRWHEYVAKFTDGRLVEIVADEDAARKQEAFRARHMPADEQR